MKEMVGVGKKGRVKEEGDSPVGSLSRSAVMGFFARMSLFSRRSNLTIYGARHEPITQIKIGLFHLDWFALGLVRTHVTQ